MIEIPTAREREYLDVFGCVAIFIAASTNGVPCLIGYAPNLATWLESIRKRWHWSVDYASAWWVHDRLHATRLVEAINAQMPVDAHGLFEAEASHVAELIELAAERRSIALTTHEDAMLRVRSALARVDGVIDTANGAGELAWFNKAFREWRLAQGDEGKGDEAPTYGQARARLRVAVVRRLARGEGLARDLLGEVFPSGGAQKRPVGSILEGGPLSGTPLKAKPTGGPGRGNGRVARGR